MDTTQRYIIQSKDQRKDEWKDSAEFDTEAGARETLQAFRDNLGEVLGPFRLLLRTDTLLDS